MSVRCNQLVGKRRSKGSPCDSPARFSVYNQNQQGDENGVWFSWSCEYHLFQAVKRLPGHTHMVSEI